MTEQPDPTPPRRLTRSHDDRVVGGVAAGLGRHLGVDPLLTRIAFAVLTFVGGAGVLAYLALLVLVPDEGSTEPAEVTPRRVATLVGAGILAVAILAVLDGGLGLGLGWWLGPNLLVIGLLGYLAYLAYRALERREGKIPTAGRIASAVLLMLAVGALALVGLGGALWLAAAGGGEVVAGAVVALGATAVVASFFRPARWLAGVALVLALPVAFVAAADIDIEGGIGERTYRPLQAAEVQDRYELGVGELVLDLREIPWPADGVLRTEVELGVGHVVVLVPRRTCVRMDGDAGMGYLDNLGDDAGGVDVEYVSGSGSAGQTPRLELTSSVGIGAIEIAHTWPGGWDEDDDGPPFGRDRFFDAGRDVTYAGTASPICTRTQ